MVLQPEAEPETEPEPEVRVRRGTEADLPALLRMVRCCPDAPRWTEAVWRKFATAESADRLFLVAQGVCLVAQDSVLVAQGAGGELCGLLAATRLPGQTELESVLVDPAIRRRGIGRSMVEAWLAWADATGATEALLEVRASNHSAMALYASLGFVVGGRRARYYREPMEDALLMGRQTGPL